MLRRATDSLQSPGVRDYTLSVLIVEEVSDTCSAVAATHGLIRV